MPTDRAPATETQAPLHPTTTPPTSPVPVVTSTGFRLSFDDLLAAATDGTLTWETLRPGIEIARLYVTPDGGPSAALLRYAPGARLARHEHVGFEQIYVLSGSQTDDSGEHRAGSLLIHGPGTTHAIHSTRGCIVLAMWEKPVRFPE